MCYLFSLNAYARWPSHGRMNSVEMSHHHGHELGKEVGHQSFNPSQARRSFKAPFLLTMVFDMLRNSVCYWHLHNKSASLSQTSSTLALSKIISQAEKHVPHQTYFRRGRVDGTGCWIPGFGRIHIPALSLPSSMFFEKVQRMQADKEYWIESSFAPFWDKKEITCGPRPPRLECSHLWLL